MLYGSQVCHLVDIEHNIVEIGGGTLYKDNMMWGMVISYFTKTPELPTELKGGKAQAHLS